MIVSNVNKESIEEKTVKDKEYQLLKRTEIPFSEYVQVSKKRRPVPYIKGRCRLPKRYQDKTLYDFNAKGYLAVIATGEVLVSNTKTVGTPRIKKVNGQNIYNGNVSRQARASLVKGLHEQFGRYIKDIEPIQDIKHFPLGLHLHFKVHDKGNLNLDNDNRWIWRKAIQDTMVQEGIIPEDNPYVIWENLERTILISPEKEPSLVIEIWGYA